jgi:hypothetical protein
MAPRGVYNSVIIEYNVKNGTFIEQYPYIFELIDLGTLLTARICRCACRECL